MGGFLIWEDYYRNILSLRVLSRQNSRRGVPGVPASLFYLFPFSDVKVEHREKNIFYYFHERVLCQVINFPTRFIWCDRSYKYRKNQLKKCFWYNFPSRSHMTNYALLVLKYPNWHRLSPPIVSSKPKNVTCPLI